jgi:hypothetical protein
MTRVSQLNLNEETSVDLNFGAAQLRTGEPNPGAYLYPLPQWKRRTSLSPSPSANLVGIGRRLGRQTIFGLLGFLSTYCSTFRYPLTTIGDCL